jgi:hypothetical protein
MRTERGVSAPCHAGPSGDTARWTVLREIPNFLVIARIGSSCPLEPTDLRPALHAYTHPPGLVQPARPSTLSEDCAC